MTGWACEVCGKQVGPSPASVNPTAPVEGLEPTQLPADGLGLSIEPAPGLEPTASGPVPEIPGEPLLGWEATHAVVAPDVRAGGLEGMDVGRAAPESAPVAVPTVATCRYCRNVQASGLFCDRCGMRLPWVAPVHAEAPAGPDVLRPCKRCGERSPASMERCGACGALLATEP